LSVLVSATPERGSFGEIWVRQNGPAEPFDGSVSDTAGLLAGDPRAHSSVLVDIEATYHGARGSGSISLSGVDPQVPSAQASSVLATGRWTR
jgi:hypothetical protein